MQFHLGMVYSKLDNKTNAALHLKKAITLAPESPSAKDAKAALDGLG
jgi:TolA-binding protein